MKLNAKDKREIVMWILVIGAIVVFVYWYSNQLQTNSGGSIGGNDYPAYQQPPTVNILCNSTQDCLDLKNKGLLFCYHQNATVDCLNNKCMCSISLDDFGG